MTIKKRKLYFSIRFSELFISYWRFCQTPDMELIKNNLVNDLEDSAIAMNSDIQVIKEIFNKNGIEANLMTGSGSCVFGFFENAKKGEEVASILKKAGYITFITKTM